LEGAVRRGLFGADEQPWRWATNIYWGAIGGWLLISAVVHSRGSVTRLQILALAPAFISSALLGLYTGNIEALRGGAYRDKNPIRFWFIFLACLAIGGLCLLGGIFGPPQH
jgi:hypothetical protein